MQFLEMLQSQRSDAFAAKLLDVLEDIVHNVQITPNFCIHHPHYGGIELPVGLVKRLQHLPIAIQNQYLSLQLQNFLYTTYYNGAYQFSPVPESDAARLSTSQPLENNTVKGLNLKFYEALRDSNTGEGYFDPGWLVLRQEHDGSLVVQKAGLTLHIKQMSGASQKPARYLQLAGQSATVGDTVAIRMPHNRVEADFYIAISNAGPVKDDPTAIAPSTVNLYFNVTPAGAIALMGSLTQQLNAIPMPFTFKVLDNPDHYGYYDAGILTFEQSYYDTVRSILQTVYTETQAHFGPETPLFTKPLAPGLALSEEPNHKFSAEEDFGMNRCQIIANSLVETWRAGHHSPESRMTAILKHFSLHSVQLTCPYINSNSEDIYTPLEP